MNRWTVSTLLAASLLFAHVTEALARCAPFYPVVTAVTKAVKTSDGGGFLVMLDYRPDGSDSSTKVAQDTWRWKVGGKLVAPVIETLAPGLAVYRLPPDTKGRATLMNGNKVVGTLASKKGKPAALPAPKVVSLKQETSYERKGSSIRMTATLSEKAPPGAYALVVADDKKGRGFGKIADYSPTSIVVFSHSPCGTDPDGTVTSVNGEKLRLYWVDKVGNASPAADATLVASGDSSHEL